MDEKKLKDFQQRIKSVEEKARKEVKKIKQERDKNIADKYFKSEDSVVRVIERDDEGDIVYLHFTCGISEETKQRTFSFAVDYRRECYGFKFLDVYKEEITKQEYIDFIMEKIKEIIEE